MVLPLTLLIKTIIGEYFLNSGCLFILSDDSNNFLYNLTFPIVNLKLINASIDEEKTFQNYGCQGIIIQHENPSAVITDMEEKLKLQKERFNFRKYLIILNSDVSGNLTEIFNQSALQYIIDMLIIIPERESAECKLNLSILCEPNQIFKLITHRYIGENYNNDPVLLNVWFSNNQSFLSKNSLYPDKISNQKGRILRCATFSYKPYTIIDDSPPAAIGPENALIHEYTKRHNLTIQFVVDDELWGIIYDNWTGYGLLGNIATDKADVGYAALYSWEHEYRFLDFSKVISRTGITCLVPAPRLATGWLTPLFPFSLEMWIGFGISFVLTWSITTVITVFLSKLHSKAEESSGLNYRKICGQSFGRIFKIFLTQGVTTTDKEADKALKYVFIIFLFSLLTSSSYSSGLASVMTLPRYEGAINTVWDLANSGIRWGATSDAWLYSILDEKRPQYLTIMKTFVTTSAENLMEFAKTNDIAFSIERLTSGQFAIGNYVTESIVRTLRLMDDDLYWEYCVFMLRKSSMLLESLNDMVFRLTETGITQFWELKAAQIHMDLRVQNIVRYYATAKDEEREGTIKLQWVHVEGVFGILIVGHVISVICFIIEMIVYKYQLRKNAASKFEVIPE